MSTRRTPLSPRSGSSRLPSVLLAALALLVANGAAANDTNHVVKILNRCSQQVWLGVNGSPAVSSYDIALAPRCTAANAATVCSTGVCKGGSCSCSTDADCAFGSTAGTTATCDTGRHRCLDRTKLLVPATWNGRIWARTGCSGSNSAFVCESGQCGPPTGGNADCQGTNGDVATLFELNASPQSALDNFDVSLVSGYNLPIAVKVVFPADAPFWQPSTTYSTGTASIIARTSVGIFNFVNVGPTGTSGATEPKFPSKWGHEVADGANIVWRNTGAVCIPSGCKRSGIRKDQCPTSLQSLVNGNEYAGCNAPSNTCSTSDADCSYYQCVNSQAGAEQDLFGNNLGFQSGNGASPICYTADDCSPGKRCLLDPDFKTGVKMPSGTGVCVPVSQDGQCSSAMDGDPCPGINYPYVGYTCQTLSGRNDGVKVCLPPTASGVGDVWWDFANWTNQSTSCTAGGGQCSTDQKCLVSAVQKGLRECSASDVSCTCYAPTTCTQDSDCQGTGQCLDSTGLPCGTQPCYCSPQATYSGVCGASNQAWIDAAADLGTGIATWPQGFRDSCPVAYGYQYDDPASNWFCPNPGAGLNGYRVVLCGNVKH